MKVNVTIDCTPEEARAFMGLPDLGSIHEAYFSKMREALDTGSMPDGVERLVRSWGPVGEAGLGLWQRLMEQGNPTRS